MKSLILYLFTIAYSVPCDTEINLPQKSSSHPCASDFCLPSTNEMTNWVSLGSDTPFVVRRIVVNGTSIDRMRVSVSEGAGDKVWYKTNPESAWAWVAPSFEENHIGVFDVNGLPSATNVTIWPIPAAGATSGSTEDATSRTEFSISLQGCYLNETRTVQYMFNTSISSIGQSFSSVLEFENSIKSVLATKIDLNRLIVSSKFVAINQLLVTLLILPDAVSESCVNQVAHVLSSDPSVLEGLRTIQGFAKDDSGMMCYNKSCPGNTICINGQCISQNGNQLSPDVIVPPPVSAPVQLRVSSTASRVYKDDEAAASSRNNTALIVGGTIGGVILLILFIHCYSK